MCAQLKVGRSCPYNRSPPCALTRQRPQPKTPCGAAVGRGLLIYSVFNCALAWTPTGPGLTLLEAVRREIRARHLSIRTEQQYVYWVRCFVRHFQRRHVRELGAAEVESFLAMLANDRRVAASTHN